MQHRHCAPSILARCRANAHSNHRRRHLCNSPFPRYEPQFVVSKPARTKEAGVEEEKVWVEKPGVRVYVDGSGQGGGIGAAAALYVPGILENSPRMLHYHMGRASQYTPYEADLVSIILGIELLWRQQADETCMEHGASIAADNLCAIFNPQRQTSQPGHYLFDELHRAVSRLQAKHPHTNLTFRWVPGHRGIEGNVVADKGAKEAARGRTSPPEELPPTLHLEHLLFVHNCWMYHLPKSSSPSPSFRGVPPKTTAALAVLTPDLDVNSLDLIV